MFREAILYVSKVKVFRRKIVTKKKTVIWCILKKILHHKGKTQIAGHVNVDTWLYQYPEAYLFKIKIPIFQSMIPWIWFLKRPKFQNSISRSRYCKKPAKKCNAFRNERKLLLARIFYNKQKKVIPS